MADGGVGAEIQRQVDQGRLRILIVGAGVAGLTLAALLQQRGERPVVVERQGDEPGTGYMLGLLPLGGRVLNGLGLRPAYLEASRPMHWYECYGRTGQKLAEFSLSQVIAEFGAYQGIERGDLIDLLRSAVAQDTLFYRTTVVSLSQHDTGVTASFADGSAAELDAVVGCDGMASWTRQQILGPSEFQYVGTGWGGWVCWIDGTAETLTDTYRELWSAGWGAGLYPVRDRVGLFLAGQLDWLRGKMLSDYLEWVLPRLPDGVFKDALELVDPAQPAFFWRLEDCSTSAWYKGRVALCGDAAAGFLPTAGVGASMAMDSAAVLADELSRADPSRLSYALRLYENRQRPRVAKAQKNSRDLAKLMFVGTPALAALRDQLLKLYSTDRFIKDITELMEGR